MSVATYTLRNHRTGAQLRQISTGAFVSTAEVEKNKAFILTHCINDGCRGDYNHASFDGVFIGDAVVCGGGALQRSAVIHRDYSFRGATLKNVSFIGVCLDGFNFQDAVLENVSFTNCGLVGCQFAGAKFVGTCSFDDTSIIECPGLFDLGQTFNGVRVIGHLNVDGSATVLCGIGPYGFSPATARTLSELGPLAFVGDVVSALDDLLATEATPAVDIIHLKDLNMRVSSFLDVVDDLYMYVRSLPDVKIA